MFPRTLEFEMERARPLIYSDLSTPPCLSPSANLSAYCLFSYMSNYAVSLMQLVQK